MNSAAIVSSLRPFGAEENVAETGLVHLRCDGWLSRARIGGHGRLSIGIAGVVSAQELREEDARGEGVADTRRAR